MENILIEFDEKITELKELADQIKNYIGEAPVSRNVREGFSSFYANIAVYSDATESEDLDEIVNAAKIVAIYGQSIGQGLAQSKNTNEQIRSVSSELLRKATNFRDLVENSPFEYKSLDVEGSQERRADISSYNSVKKNLKKLSDSHLEHDQRIKKLLNENDTQIGDLSSRIHKINSDATIELDKITALHKETLVELESKKEQINEILGHVSGRAVAGDFETSASEEKVMANWLRYASLGCMTVIVIVVGYSFWETTTSAFQWQNSVFRMLLAVMLSVPAAYLARESAKHREQQYSHLQTSLDLKAITPYIASLPDDEQHKIKVEVASRLFAAKNFARTGADPYPINVHEIVMEIVKMLDVSRRDSKSKNG